MMVGLWGVTVGSEYDYFCYRSIQHVYGVILMHVQGRSDSLRLKLWGFLGVVFLWLIALVISTNLKYLRYCINTKGNAPCRWTPGH